MNDKAKLGTRYTCFQCGTKFYDLNRPVPACPDCEADQRDAPTRDVRALLSGRGRPRPKVEDEPVLETKEGDGDEEEEDEFDSIKLPSDDDE